MALAITTVGFVYLTHPLAPTPPFRVIIMQLGRPLFGTALCEARGAGGRLRIEGRVLDLEGRPIAGATVAIKRVPVTAPDGKLDTWIDETGRLGKQPCGAQSMGDSGA